MTEKRSSYDQLRVKAEARDKQYGRYLALLISAAILICAVSFNALAEETKPAPTAQMIWTDYNSSDPGRNVDPQKQRELQAELAAEMAAEATATGKARPAHDAWLLHSFGVRSAPKDH